MLEKDPARRFQTPVELLRALEEFTTGANLPALTRPDAATATDSEQDTTAIATLQQQVDSSIPPELRQEVGPNWEML